MAKPASRRVALRLSADSVMANFECVTPDKHRAIIVDGGFVQVADNVVSVLTNKAVPASAINAGAAQEQLRAALSSHAAGTAEMATRDRHVSQARGQLRVAGQASGAHTGH